ncbi:MAG: extracellular solute-binding protein [Chlamydiia bacterium]|nr:extracellular solute-binding protein [Chlamydiia bacterium]
MKRFTFLFFFCLAMNGWAADIVVVHAFDGFLKEQFTEIVEAFNAQSEKSHVTPSQAKNYKEAFEEGIAAHRLGKGPHILQVYEVATLSMMLQEDLYIPVSDLLEQFHACFDQGVYIDVVRKFYSAPNGKMLSLPWNASTGIVFYNKEAFRKAGLDPNVPPKTWPDLEKMGRKLKGAGYIGYTTAWPAAYHLEHLSCWHDIPFATEENGFKGIHARLFCNHPEQVFHIDQVAKWSKEGIFSYSGRFTETPEDRFAKGECAILMQGANRLPILKKKCPFEIGVGFMPYWPHLTEKPHTLNIGGSSFWALQGFSNDDYRSMAEFFTYLSKTEVQKKWHQATGYLPITEAAYEETKKEGFYVVHPAAEIAVLEVMENAPTPHSWGIRLGNYVEVRDLIIDALEKAFSGEMSAQEALDQAVAEGNKRLETFEKGYTNR